MQLAKPRDAMTLLPYLTRTLAVILCLAFAIAAPLI